MPVPCSSPSPSSPRSPRTVALRSRDGFTRAVPSAVVVVGYGISFWLLALVLKQLSRRHHLRRLVRRRHRADRRGRHVRVRRARDRAQAREPRPDHPRRRRAQHGRQRIKDTRAKLLDAAAAVVRRDGAQALTLDAVAAEAGVSKGGLLYHFKSKRELLDALVERWLDEFQREIDAADGGFVARLRAAPRTAPRRRSRACSRRSSPTPRCWPRCASGTRPGRIASPRRAATRWRPPWPGWPPTGCGSPTCSGWRRRHGELRERVLARLLEPMRLTGQSTR